jgi:hypothetical protein
MKMQARPMFGIESRPQRMLCLVLCSLASIMVIVGEVYFAVVAWRQVESGSWPTVEATVIDGRFEAVGGGSRSPGSTHVVIDYWYEVDGHRYSSNRYNMCGSRAGDVSELTAFLKGHPGGSRLSVSFNPADPSVAVIAPGAKEVPWWGLLVLVLNVFPYTLIVEVLREVFRGRSPE